jgi:hypothetical protein
MAAVAVALAGTVGCRTKSVQWGQPQSAPGDTLGLLTLDGRGVATFGRQARASADPPDAQRCGGSLAVTTDGDRWYAAWLRLRTDSTVSVVAAGSDGGQVWNPAAVVDSLDAGKFGCARPGPSIAAANGYVHVAYSLKAPEGYGVFFAHSMDKGATFHDAMTVVYGDRLSFTATAAHGMRVAIAYDDPSGKGKRVDVALSETQGHTFEPRERGSPDEMAATQPRIAIRDTVVAVSFAGGDGVGRAVRIGVIKSD